MRLAMFHPVDHAMERGWVGRIEDGHVIHLAAQTLQSFFSGGGTAREHAVYPLADVRLLAPVLHPPSVRIFDEARSFAFANPAAIVGPGALIPASAWARVGPCDDQSQGGSRVALGRGSRASVDRSQGGLSVGPRVAAVLGSDGEIGGFTGFAEWRRDGVAPPKDRDFALGLGPVVLTPDELDVGPLDAAVRLDGEVGARMSLAGFDWDGAAALAGEGTALFPGDLLVGPAVAHLPVGGARSAEVEIERIGALPATVER